jgi:hypothetical protein
MNAFFSEKELNDEQNKMNENEKKFENICFTKKLLEIILNSYNACKGNYYYCLNINNIILSYYKTGNIKDKISEKILTNNYLNSIEIKLKQMESRNVEMNQDEDEKEKEKEKEYIYRRISEMKENYEKKLKQKINEIENEKKLNEIIQNRNEDITKAIEQLNIRC